MRTRRGPLAALAMVVLAGVAPALAAPRAEADRMVASSPLRYGVEFLSAYRGVVVWGGLATGPGVRWAYFASEGGPAKRLSFTSPEGGDLDLGPDRTAAPWRSTSAVAT